MSFGPGQKMLRRLKTSPVSRVVWDSVAVVAVAVAVMKRIGMLDRLPPERDKGANTFSLSA
jgi:hypothetical protein